ncbi:MAG: hydantoinase/oxoprolinase family protein [candidate division KSB1 bacterium]|nr:hydantoinase/oxoprolinase family protein [candidate division KSB1 bacterium]
MQTKKERPLPNPEPIAVGLDVGGTHTDVAAIRGREIIAHVKTVTDPEHLVDSVTDALERIQREINADIDSLNLSTTLSTNALVEGRAAPVGVLVSAGPGIAPEVNRYGDYYHVLDGFIDHRGTEVRPLNTDGLDALLSDWAAEEIQHFAVIGKFSTRNPEHENQMFDAVQPYSNFTTRGHMVSGYLNFPRRIRTAAMNSSVWPHYQTFYSAVTDTLKCLNIQAHVNVLKADGGTLPFPASRDVPVETVHSGPAASVMGALALRPMQQDVICMDMGGTTTDVALFARGAPVLERSGIRMAGYDTLVRAIQSHSVGIGGDSALQIKNGSLQVGPQRQGPCLAAGGPEPALMDALNVLGYAEFGDMQKSKRGIEHLTESLDCSVMEAASSAVHAAADILVDAVTEMLREINSKPVYTLYEMFHPDPIKPTQILLMGGPADAFQKSLIDRFSLPVDVLPWSGVANAVGAALCRVTLNVDLFADTVKGIRSVAQLNVRDSVSSRYNLRQAKKDARRYLLQYAQRMGASPDQARIDVHQAEEFNQVAGASVIGRTLRVKSQIRPGLTGSLKGLS